MSTQPTQSAHSLVITDPDELNHVDLAIDGGGVPRCPVIVLDADQIPETNAEQIAGLMQRRLPMTVLVCASGRAPDSLTSAADLVIARPGLCGLAVETDEPFEEAARFVQKVLASPRAAVTLAWILRQGDLLDVPGALAAESAAYSMLLGSADFLAWLAARPERRPKDPDDRLRVVRDGNVLRVTLARARRRNAVDTLMRHALLEVLQLAEVDDELTVEISAEGPSFSAGGDLDEFGTASDPAVAHLIRVSASAGQRLYDLRDRVVVRVHGACIGAGIELPAFAGRITATPDAVFGLPEVPMGLIPGAGGTVSIPRRIGRGRTLWMGVTGDHVDVETALKWGLIDGLS